MGTVWRDARNVSAIVTENTFGPVVKYIIRYILELRFSQMEL
jgi:hypothetical protein